MLCVLEILHPCTIKCRCMISTYGTLDNGMYCIIIQICKRVAVIWSNGLSENPVFTFPIKKRINTGLFIGRMALLSIGETRISNTYNRDGILWLEGWAYVLQNCFVDIKRWGNERISESLSWNEWNGNVEILLEAKQGN